MTDERNQQPAGSPAYGAMREDFETTQAMPPLPEAAPAPLAGTAPEAPLPEAEDLSTGTIAAKKKSHKPLIIKGKQPQQKEKQEEP